MSAAVTSRVGFPLIEDTLRPFRLWDAEGKRYVRWRIYANRINAHKAALWEAGISKVKVTIEVYDVRNGMLLGQFTQTATGVKIYIRRGELKNA